MECAEIRRSLSGYLDSALDAQTTSLVEKHVLTCRACRETLESLRSVVQELGDLRPVKPPEDFIEQLHDRMATRFSLKELTMRLFVPFQIKIPFQFATAAAMAVLIFFIIHTPEIEKEMADIPRPEAIRERVKETGSMDSSKESPKQEALAPASGISPPGEPHSEELLAAYQKKAAPVKVASKRKKVAPEPMFHGREYVRKPSAEEAESKLSVEEAVKAIEVVLLLKSEASIVRELIYNVKGTVLSTEYDRNTDRPKSLETEIPAGQYGFFFKKLQQLGTLQTPTPAIDATGLERIKIRIQFTYS